MPSKTITTEELEAAYKQVNEQEWYKTNLEIIKDFLKLHPENTDVNVVAAKVALIDLTNSTQFSMHQKDGVTLKQFAQNIVDCGFDNRIGSLNSQLVTDICKGYKKKLKKNLFSLATKYCHYHNRLLEKIPDDNRYEYPIYDSNVRKNIPDYIDGVSEKDIEGYRQNGDYETFNRIIEQVLDSNGITKEMMPDRKVKLDCLLYSQGVQNNNKKKQKKD